MTKGIDISRFQKSDFSLKDKQIDFAILRIGGRDGNLVELFKDAEFDNYYQQAKEIGLPIGAYYLGNAHSIDMAIEEAKHCCELLKNHRFEYPIYYDVEAGMLKNSKELLTEMIIAFCDYLEDNGYFVGIYGSEYALFRDAVIDEKLSPYTHWVAAYYSDIENPPVLESGNATDIWQWTSSVIMQDRPIDQDICYQDFPEIITSLGFNNYDKEIIVEPTESTEPEPTPIPISDNIIKVGDVVEIIGDCYYNGGTVPDWVKQQLWIVEHVDGDRIVVDKNIEDKYNIMSPFNIKDIRLVKEPITSEPAIPEPVNDLKFSINDIVEFSGGSQYPDSNADAGFFTDACRAKVTSIAIGAKHPYHLRAIGTDGNFVYGVYGWVDADTVFPVVMNKKSNEEIAKEIWTGVCSDPRWDDWGTGNVRKQRLTDAGYNYSEVQEILNNFA